VDEATVGALPSAALDRAQTDRCHGFDAEVVAMGMRTSHAAATTIIRPLARCNPEHHCNTENNGARAATDAKEQTREANRQPIAPTAPSRTGALYVFDELARQIDEFMAEDVRAAIARRFGSRG